MKVELNKEQIKNILVFLERTSLKGNEVVAYVDIINTLSESLESEGEVDEL